MLSSYINISDTFPEYQSRGFNVKSLLNLSNISVSVSVSDLSDLNISCIPWHCCALYPTLSPSVDLHLFSTFIVRFGHLSESGFFAFLISSDTFPTFLIIHFRHFVRLLFITFPHWKLLRKLLGNIFTDAQRISSYIWYFFSASFPLRPIFSTPLPPSRLYGYNRHDSFEWGVTNGGMLSIYPIPLL